MPNQCLSYFVCMNPIHSVGKADIYYYQRAYEISNYLWVQIVKFELKYYLVLCV